MSESACPQLEDLMPLVDGETPPAAVAEHVAGCVACRGRVEGMRSQRTTMQLVAASPRDEGDRHPAVLGKYFIAGVLRGNERYTVYRGAHMVLREDVAVQLAAMPVMDDAARKLMLGEARKLAQIAHGGVARVLDLDFFEERPFVVTQYVRGPAINDVSELGPHTPQRSAEWVASLAEAVAAGHQMGVCHLDIQPRHVRIDAAGRPRLLMFGSALLQGVRQGALPVGDPAFVAPEQSAGRREEVGPASDVYALGALLTYLLTGEAGMAKMMGMPGKIEAACAAAMEVAIVKRPSAAAFAASLRGGGWLSRLFG